MSPPPDEPKCWKNWIGRFLDDFFYSVLSTISLKSHDNFLLYRLISFVALGHSSVDGVVWKFLGPF